MFFFFFFFFLLLFCLSFFSHSLSLSLSFVVSVRSFCFQSLSPPTYTSTSSGSSSSFLLFTSLCISLCFHCLCMCHLCAMSIKLFFPEETDSSPDPEERQQHSCSSLLSISLTEFAHTTSCLSQAFFFGAKSYQEKGISCGLIDRSTHAWGFDASNPS